MQNYTKSLNYDFIPSRNRKINVLSDKRKLLLLMGVEYVESLNPNVQLYFLLLKQWIRLLYKSIIYTFVAVNVLNITINIEIHYHSRMFEF